MESPREPRSYPNKNNVQNITPDKTEGARSKKQIIEMQISLNTEQVSKKTCELIELLERANSLADELARTLKHLEINIDR